jgi:polyhydroxyalkanoate synthesis regulator phasin
MKPRFLAALGVGLGLAAGGATAVAVGTPGLAGAASPAASSSTDDSTDTTTAPSTSATTDESTSTDSTEPADPADPVKPAPGEFLQETLQPLIDDGTLTQEQADKVIAALQEARPFAGRGHGPGFGGHGHHMIFGLDTAATALGVSTEDLRTALADGKSIADVAAEHGVDVQTVIDALVAQASTHLDEAVADGRLTEEEAATRKTEVTEKITELVNQAGGLRPGRPDAPDVPAAPDATDTPDTTTGD